ncbi:TonB-dependent receptor [Hufsiella ginkgonis]|uniref:TonB-dependent receptor n=1 Tax=Hufsiella ginkgonis TaxID=2695274 RepID=A0A7K1XU03_9SPHI|nr:TonB-dependent receptor [Hufsiella ginkgonis]MXV14430.1 TonB-dependent receptor [Hufsiella ginkgonis]
MKKFAFVALCFLLTRSLFAQQGADSVVRMEDVQVKGYFSDRPLLRSPASAAVIGAAELSKQPNASLVSAINALPGIRMEERSPGSYRLSVRGSLLRSPFGIRNLKVYLDEFPLTDAGGNTYLNLLDAGSTGRIEFLRGPEGSVFGANSGGAILLNPRSYGSPGESFSIDLGGGSFGLFQERAFFQERSGKYNFSVNQAYQRSDGYRQNSGLHRKYANLSQQWKYRPNANIRAVLLFSDLDYQTPGGLTAVQSAADPKAARPPAGTAPGAADQKAAIYNKTVLGGVLHEIAITRNWKHVISLSGFLTDFKNPFITNYETRKENTWSLRTYAELKDTTGSTVILWNTGLEAQQTNTDFKNYTNNQGIKGSLMAADKLRANQDFAFTHLSLDLFNRLVIEGAASINLYSFGYSSSFPAIKGNVVKRLNNQLMPRLASSFLISPAFAWRASVSRGYSPPTIAEIRASDNVINTGLQPETGWNYETGLRYRTSRFSLDASVFRYKMQQAIVRRVTASDQEYYINAGGTRQTGVESQVSFLVIAPRTHGLVRALELRNSYTYSNFLFSDYKNAAADYSGNKLTGVPSDVLVTSLQVSFPGQVYIFGQHNYTGKIPLNDAGTAYADKFDLLQVKTGWRFRKQKGYTLSLYAGADNLLNEKYSLGNDLNAFGGRYFNPSPGRNYYAGVSVGL